MHDTELTRFQEIGSGIIDSHAHLTKEFYPDDRELIIENMKAVNVRQIINPGIDLKDIPELIELADKNENIYIGIGLHPHQASEWDESSVKVIEKYISHAKVVAIGECGLDFHYNNSPKDTQIFVLKEQIRIARQFNKPVIIHCRDAWNELFEILTENTEPIRGVLHCFTGNAEVINRLKRLGDHIDFYVSFSGILTFPKAQEIRAASVIVDDDKLLVETDCPFLAPVPVRGERNEPTYVWYTAEKLAALKNKTLNDIATLCSNNARRLFALPADKSSTK